MSAIEAPRNARSRRTRQRLLAAARSLVEDAGLEAVTMAAVAERAGVTRRALYLHFTSRTELLTALFTYVNETGHLARYHPRMIRIGRALQRARDTDPDAAAHWDLVMRDWRAHCRRLANWLDREGRLAPHWTVQTATDMLWVLMSFDVIEGLVVDRHWSRRRLADQLARLFRATFVAR